LINSEFLTSILPQGVGHPLSNPQEKLSQGKPYIFDGFAPTPDKKHEKDAN
jgi:hypothetical protein